MSYLYSKAIVLAVFIILVVGLTPSLISIWMMRQIDTQAQARLRRTLEAIATRRLSDLQSSPDQHYIQGVGFIVGDITCQYNARSHYLRCAVNPMGPCQDCSQYDAKPFG